MTTNPNLDLAALRQMTPGQLRDKYRDVFGEPTRTGNKDYLIKRLAWRLQSLAEGSLSDRARRRAIELARDADIRMTVPRPCQVPRGSPGFVSAPLPAPVSRPGLPMPGTVLTRDYRGRTIQVTVLPKGFEYEGQILRSLTAVAKAVTGAHWNGHHFFGLRDGDSK